MNFTVSEEDFEKAIHEALDICSKSETNRSSGEEAFSKILAWVWDSTLSDAKLEDLEVLDLYFRDIALKLICGRLSYGRPISHPCQEDIENHYYSVTQRTHLEI